MWKVAQISEKNQYYVEKVEKNCNIWIRMWPLTNANKATSFEQIYQEKYYYKNISKQGN